MLDQLSGGRLEIGFGRGSVPIELEYYGADPGDGAGDLRGSGRARARGAHAQGARLPRQAIFLPRRADGDRAAAEAASADLVRRAHAGQRRARGAPQSQRGEPRSAAGDPALDRALPRDLAAGSPADDRRSPSSGSAASSWWRRPTPRRMALARRAYLRLARKLHVSVPPAWPRAVASPPRDLRSGGRARPGHRRRAGDGGRIPDVAARRRPAATTWSGNSPSAICTRAECLQSIGLFAQRGDAGVAARRRPRGLTASPAMHSGRARLARESRKPATASRLAKCHDGHPVNTGCPLARARTEDIAAPARHLAAIRLRA